MLTAKKVAILVIEADSDGQRETIGRIRYFLQSARLTPEGFVRFQYEIKFYEAKIAFNQNLINANNESLMISFALTLVYEVLAQKNETEKTRQARRQYSEEEQKRELNKLMNKYTEYLKILQQN